MSLCPLPARSATDDYYMPEFLFFSGQVPMTIRERRELRKWVRSGNSAYCNPWFICDENCREMSFIDAYRIVDAESFDAYVGSDIDVGKGVLPF
jgi:hypothetical protein